MECVRCVWFGATWVERGRVNERIGFGLYQSCGNRSIGRVSVFGLRWCELCGWEWIGGLNQDLEGSCNVCVRCESGFSVYMAGPGICILCLADTCAS